MYTALTATKNNETIVLVFSSERASLSAMQDLVELGNKCRRFTTDEAAFIAYSNGANFNIDYTFGPNGENLFPVLTVAA